jgi:putative ABC transport system permease protein
MTSIALKGLAGRKLRTLLTALAIVLGVAMISGTFVLTDTIHSAFDQIFRGSYENTAAVVSGKKVTTFATGGSPTVPASLVAKVRKLDGVDSATGQIFNLNDSSDYGKLIGRDGKPIGSSGNPTFAFGLDPSRPGLLPLDIASGRWAAAPGEVVIDSSSAKKEHFAVGDRIGVAVQGPTRYFRIVGTAKFGSVDSLGGATFAIFDVPTAQKLLHKEGRYDAILVSAKQGVSPETLTREIAPLLPSNAEVQTGEEQAKANAKDISEFTRFLQIFLLAFGGIALFVGAFVIANTLSITVSQRTREFATLRTLGASRRQLLRSVLLEGFVTGLVASVTGLVLGLGLAKGLSAAMSALQLDLPQTGTVFATRTVVVSILLGVIGTMLATIAPAIRATRVPPIAAVREGATLPKGRIARHRLLSSLLTVGVSVALLGYGLFAPGVGAGPRLLALAVGVLALFVGVAMGSSKLVRPLVKLVGAPSRRLGGTEGALANENANRNPARTAATAAALMIGLALVTAVATLGAGLRDSDRAALRHQVVADYVVTSQNGWDPLSVAAGNAAAAAPGVELASAVRNEQSKILGDEARVDGIDPATVSSVYRYDWVHGSNATMASLGSDGAIVREKFADKHHIAVGETIRVMNPAGRQSSFVVRGIYTQPKFGSIDPVVGSVAITQQAFAKAFDRPQNAYVFLNVKGGSSDGETAALQKALAGYPEAKLHDRHGWVEERAKGIDKLLALLYVLLALSVIVSLFGMVNTLVLSVFERTREIGMLRAVGMSRAQTRRMITHESVITALIGAGLGLPLGVFLAGLITRALSDQGVSFTVPVVPLLAFAVVAVVAGLLASIAPARRAARLRPLEALKYE